jgi:peptidoglycan recognition protein
VNSNSIGICIIGSFKTTAPNALALKAVQDLIACGVSKGYLKSNYILKGHRQVTSTDCPGKIQKNYFRNLKILVKIYF